METPTQNAASAASQETEQATDGARFGSLEEKVAKIIASSVEGLGYTLVRVRYSGGEHKTLQIMAERADNTGMTVDDCSRISRTVSALLDVEDPIPEGYRLEISSPGMDRPLVRPEDFERFAGQPAKITVRPAIDGRKHFKGILDGFEDNEVRLTIQEGNETLTIGLPYAQVSNARLNISESL
ncbi:MAG: ribosome maturation factor RimP [Hyphomicrobiales bacterium]|nr:ribosome maturation factor RimP [Hyphomicrobiales bacterium]